MPEQPKKPQNAFFLYLEANKSDFVKQADGVYMDAISLGSKTWRGLPKEDRAPYQEKAKAAKKQYDQDRKAFTHGGRTMKKCKTRKDNKNWELYFTLAADPNALAANLNGSLSFKCNKGVATVHGCNFHCSFEGAISKKKLLQACTETFRRWAKGATFANWEHHLVKVQPKASANGNAAAEGGKTYNGTRGLASDGRSCPGQAGAAEADKEQAPENPKSSKRSRHQSPVGQDTATGEEETSGTCPRIKPANLLWNLF